MEVYALFLNKAGRLRSGWRLGIFTLVLIGLYYLLSTFVRVAIIIALATTGRANLGAHGAYFEDIIFRVLLLVAGVLAGWICNRVLEGLPFRAFGLAFHSHWFRDLLVGSLIGAGSIALAVLVAVVGGGLRFQVSERALLPGVLRTLVSTLVLFIVAALAEEALFRGYPLQTLSRTGLVWLAILLTSLPFAAVHLRNPNVVEPYTFINTALAGVWLAAAYLRTRSLWLPLGVHWAWNWAQGSIFGIHVSGIKLSAHPLLTASHTGPDWLTGGSSYGIEGGLACTIALIVSTIFIWRTGLVSANAELKLMTSQENPTRANAR
jgi:membrane protease YdiL (CAAX protease family)